MLTYQLFKYLKSIFIIYESDNQEFELITHSG